MKRNQGFTLVELAIVLVVIGLILGMAFKGKDLIDGAKVKNLAAQYNKIVAGANTFYEKYGFYPGDGCPNVATPTIAQCQNSGLARNGRLSEPGEANAFWVLLIDRSNILTAADRRSVFGQNWTIWAGAPNGRAADYLDFPGGPQADPRYACALDRMMDDGVWNTGLVMSDRNYNANTDCWGLIGQADLWIRVLP